MEKAFYVNPNQKKAEMALIMVTQNRLQSNKYYQG